MYAKKIIYHYKRNEDNKDCILEVPYYETIQKINGKDFRKIFILDICYLKHREEIFRNFDNFQAQLLADEFFSLLKDTEYPITFSLYFLNYNNKIVNCEEILYDYHFALKDFISIDEYNKILRVELNLIVVNSNSSYNSNGKTIQTNNFNLIYGLNGSGKTSFLKDMASKKKFTFIFIRIYRLIFLNNLRKIINY